MKNLGVVFVGLFALFSTAYAASPSSIAASGGIKPSTVSDNGGFDFAARDNGAHAGWCKGQGHLALPGNSASGHRNHSNCEVDDGGGDGGGGDDGDVEECVRLGIPCDN